MEYDAVYLGRFHPQKGVRELIEIWDIVNSQLPSAKLVMIGDGELLKECKEKANKNITFTGELYGHELNQVIRSSSIGVHPSIYDSGGMALAQIMDHGLPGVSFNLSALASYYPMGVVKVPCFDKKRFAQEIITLITDIVWYNRMSRQAKLLIESKWKWERRAEEIWNEMVHHLYQ